MITHDTVNKVKQLRDAAICLNKEYTELLGCNSHLAADLITAEYIVDNVARIVTDNILSHPGFRDAIIKELNLQSELTQLAKAIEGENGK